MFSLVIFNDSREADEESSMTWPRFRLLDLLLVVALAGLLLWPALLLRRQGPPGRGRGTIWPEDLRNEDGDRIYPRAYQSWGFPFRAIERREFLIDSGGEQELGDVTEVVWVSTAANGLLCIAVAVVIVILARRCCARFRTSPVPLE